MPAGEAASRALVCAPQSRPMPSGRTQGNVARVYAWAGLPGRTLSISISDSCPPADNLLPRVLLICAPICPKKDICPMVSNEPFFHRRSKDGAIDSICTRCYVTVGTARNESELPEIEHNHTCDPYWLLRWQQQSA